MGKLGRPLGREDGRACLSFPSGFGNFPFFIRSLGRSTSGAWQRGGDRLGCAGVGNKVSPGIRGPDSSPARPTDYERTPAFGLPVPAP